MWITTRISHGQFSSYVVPVLEVDDTGRDVSLDFSVGVAFWWVKKTLDRGFLP